MKNMSWMRGMGFAFSLGLLFAGAASAANITWTGSVNGTWNTTTANWTGDATVYTDGTPGDSVAFVGGANPAISIAAIYSPAGLAFNNPTVNFTFTGGGIGGTGVLSKAGAADAIFASTASFTGYSGAINITGGRLLRLQDSGAGSFGSGTITLDGGTLGVKYTAGWAGTTTITNPIVVTASGGRIAGLFNDGNNAAYTGLITLNSGSTLNLEATGGEGSAYYLTFGAMSLGGNAAIKRNYTDTFLYGGTDGRRPVYLSSVVSGAVHTLTLDGINLRVQPTGSLIVSNLVVEKELWVEGRAGAAFVTLGTGGTVRVATNGVLALQNTTLDASKLVLQDGATLLHMWGNWNCYPTIQNALSVESNRTVWLGVQSGGDTMAFPSGLVFNAGGRLVVGPSNRSMSNGARGAAFSGTARFLGGSRIEANILSANGTALASGAIILGDANSGNAETITIKGQGAGALAFAASSVTDIGGVTLRYEAATNATPFKVGWGAVGWNAGAGKSFLNARLIGGSAATEFAPLATTNDNGKIIAVGPTNGTVFMASVPATLVTAGTVEFRNSSLPGADAWTPAGLGGLVVTNNASLSFSTNGLVVASNVTFCTGSTLALAVVGTATNGVGGLKATGTVQFQSGTTLSVSNPSGFKPSQGGWQVAQAATFVGAPAISTPGYRLTVEGGFLLLSPKPAGTVIAIR